MPFTEQRPAVAENHSEWSGPPGEAQWAQQWRRHHGELIRYTAYLLSGDVHAAEDVLQEAAIRYWRHAETLRNDQAVGGWLRTVAHNIVVDRSRRRRVRPTEVALAPEVDGESADAFAEVDATAAVTTLLAGLSPHHRTAVYEVYVRDRPVAEVAAELGIPSGTVKSRCYTALHQLRSAGLARCA